MDLSATEADLVYQKIQAILRGLDDQNPTPQSDPGMLRWTLHKSLDRNPNSGNIMVEVLIKELEKAELEDNLHYIIPLLHTLMYAITKAAYISDELYEQVYVFCKKILTLPKPYCTIGLDYAQRLRTEKKVPGKELMLFMRETGTTDAETEYVKEPELNLDSEVNEQHRISVWSNDSGIEKDLLGAEEKESAKLYRKPCIKKKGADMDSAVLLQNLTKAPKGSRAATLQRLSGQSTEVPAGPDRLPTARLVILGDDRALGRLAKAYYSFRKREARRPYRTVKANLQFYCIPILGEGTDTSADVESAAMSDICEISTYLGQVDPWYDKNINTLYDRITKLALMPPCPSRDSTADPFILDVASYYLRFGSQPVFFQIYSVKIHFRDFTLEPVEDVFLSELKIDLQDCTFTKLNTVTRKKTVVDSRGAGIQVHYQKALASHREREESLVVRTSGAVIETISNNEGDDLVCLNVYICETGKSTLSERSSLCKLNGLKASSIQMRSLDLRTLSLQLDKDSRRVYNNVSSQFQPIYLPFPKCYTYTWDQDNFDVLNNVLIHEEDTRAPNLSPEYEVNEEEDVDDGGEEEEYEEFEEVEEEIHNESNQKDSVFSSNSRRYVYWSTPSNVQEEANMANISNHSMQFVSNLSSCVDSGYIEDSDDSSQETLERMDYREEKVNRKFTHKIYKLFRPKNHLSKGKSKTDLTNSPNHSITGSMSSLQNIPLRRAGSLCTPQGRRVPVRSKRSQSLPQHALGVHIWEIQQNQKLALKRRPFLSCNEDSKASILRVVVFGSDRISGKLARAYSNLRLKESKCPLLTRFFKLQLYYVPVRRNSLSPTETLTNPDSPLKSPSPAGKSTPEDLTGTEESTNDISHYIGMLDPWYKRNILGLMDLPTSVLSQSSSPDNSTTETQKMPILADMVLYYCRFANRSLLLQLYQAEITFDGGRKQTEVFIQSLEMGHSAALRAIKASGPGCKRLGIDGDREAIPFTLQIVYSKSSVSGRSRWSDGEKVCTSVSLRKACKTLEELDSKMECLNLTVREVVKRQNSKTKKSFNQQISISQIKVDKAQIIAQNGGTFPLCLDQDERKILQRVIKCEVSPCYKPEMRDFRHIYRPHWSHTSQDQFCSLLCLPVATFSGAQL